MSSQSYDLIVIGDDFAGLIAACLCASRGMRVLLAESFGRADQYRLGKEVLPYRGFVMAADNSPPLDRIVEELNFHHQLKRRLLPMQSPCQALLPKRYINLGDDQDELARSLKRVHAGSQWFAAAQDPALSLHALLQRDLSIPGSGFWEKREVNKAIAPIVRACEDWIGADRSDTEYAISELCALGMSKVLEPSAVARLHHLLAAQRGFAGTASGWHGWREMFYEKFATQGGEVRSIDVQSLQIGWGKVTGVNGLEEQYSCNYCIAATPLSNLVPWLDGKAAKKVESLASQIRPLAFRYTLNLIAGSQAIPEAMSEIAFSRIDPSAPPQQGNFATIQCRPGVEAGKTIVTIEGLTQVDADGAPDLTGMREALVAHLEERMPFLAQHIDAVDSPHEPPAPAGPSRDLPTAVAPVPLWTISQSNESAMQELAYSVGIKHLSLASSQNLPELGLEGQLIAGISAAKQASASVGNKKSSTGASVLTISQSQ